MFRIQPNRDRKGAGAVAFQTLPAKGDEDGVAHALVRAVFALLRTQGWQKDAFTRV